MKYIKITLILFALSLIFVTFSVKGVEGKITIQNIELPAFKKLKRIASGAKTEENLQYYYNIALVNNATGNYNQLKVQILNKTAGGGTNFLTLDTGVAATWTTASDRDKIRTTGNYELYAKNATYSIASAKMVGVWYLNKSRYDENFN